MSESNSVFRKTIFRDRKGKSKVENVNVEEIRKTYEQMFIFVVKMSDYDIQYVKRMPLVDFMRLFEICKELIKNKNE